LDLGFDHVGVRRLSALFLFLRDVEELPGFVHAALRIGIAARRNHHGVIILHHGGGQAPAGDFGARAGNGFGRDGHLVVRALAGRVHIGMDSGLVGVNPRAIGGHEHPVIGAVALRTEKGILPVEGGQERGFGLHRVLVRDTGGQIGGEQLLAVGAGALHGILQGEAERSGRSLG
jgi:hypothetical protein